MLRSIACWTKQGSAHRWLQRLRAVSGSFFWSPLSSNSSTIPCFQPVPIPQPPTFSGTYGLDPRLPAISGMDCVGERWYNQLLGAPAAARNLEMKDSFGLDHSDPVSRCEESCGAPPHFMHPLHQLPKHQ